MRINDWIPTYVFLGYSPNDALEQEIYNKAIEVGTGWKKGNPINPNEYPEAYFMAANIIVRDKKYDETYDFLEKYLSYSNDKVQYRTMAEKMLQDAEFAKEAIKNPPKLK